MFTETLQTLIATHGYWAVFLICMLESAGVPLPGETALIAAAVFAGVTGQLDIALVISLAAAGAIIGDNIGFWVGRRYGLPLLERHGHLVRLDSHRISVGRYLFERHGAKVVFFGRFVAFLRIFAALLAGISGFNWRSFLIWNAAGGICWALIFGLGGYLFGDAIMRLTGPLGILALIGIAAGIAAAWWLARRQEKRFMAQAEQEMKAEARSGENSQQEPPSR